MRRFCIIAANLLLAVSLALLPARAQEQTERIVKIQKNQVGATQEQAKAGAGGHVDLWGVVIGVSRYKYGDQVLGGYLISNLKHAADDAQAVYDFLKSPEGGAFRDVSEGGHLVLLKDEDATQGNVEKALSMLTQAKPEDYFVLYIAGHGVLLPVRDLALKRTIEIPYFVLYDTDLREAQKTALKMETFRQIVSQIPARKGLVLSDTCHSGGVQLDGRAGSDATLRANNRYIEEMSTLTSGVGFISAAEPLERAWEQEELSQGVFTYCLLNGLSGIADKNDDGKVTFNELTAYLRDAVPRITQDKQHPHFNATALEANYLPLSVVSSVDSSGDGMLAIRTPDLDGVEVSFDGSPVRLTLTSRMQRRVKLRSGSRILTFSKGGMKRTLDTVVEPGASKTVEVNLSFSESDEEALVDSDSQQVNVFLREDKEPSKEAKELFQKGVELFNKQKFAEAVDLLSRAAQANGGAYVDALVYRGRAEQSLDKKEAAVASFKAALAARPTDFETQTLLAEAKFNAGYNVDEVIADLKSVINRHPNFDFARVVYGDVLLLHKETAAAEQQLRRAIVINSKYPPAHLILADILTYQDAKLKQQQAVEEARKALEMFAEVSKKQVSITRGLKYLSLSHIVFGGGRYINDRVMAEAHHMLAKALTRRVERDDTLSNRDELLTEARAQIQEAMKYARRLTDKHQLVLLLGTSAQNHLLVGDLPRAIEDAQQALKTSETVPDLKDYADAHYTLYSAYSSDQKYGKAMDELQKFLDVAGSQLNPSERSEYDAELKRLKRLKEGNRQKGDSQK